MRNSFRFYRSFFDYAKQLPDHLFCKAIEAIAEYALYDIRTDFVLPDFIYNTLDQDKNDAGRRCAEYARWRKSVYERDKYTCQRCGSKGGRLNAHHIKPYATHPSRRYDLENGITLCEQCHRRVHHAK